MATNDPSGPISVTDVTPQYDAYWKALGRFIHAFATTEGLMQLLLAAETATDEKTAKAIFSGVRVAEAKDLINRTRQAKGIPEDPMVTRAFAQLSVILGARNDIVHFGALFDGQAFVVSNKARAHIPTREKSFPVSPQTLTDMCDDLTVIEAALMARFLEVVWGASQALPVAASQKVLDSIRLTASAPWRYRPPQQSPPPRKRRERGPKPPRPRDA